MMKMLGVLGALVAAMLVWDCVAIANDRSDTSVNLVIKQFKKYGKTITKLPIECVSFSAVDPTPGNSDQEVELREIHDAKCGGDPQISPRVTTFTVKGGRVFVEDVISGELKPFAPKSRSSR